MKPTHFLILSRDELRQIVALSKGYTGASVFSIHLAESEEHLSTSNLANLQLIDVKHLESQKSISY